MFYAKLFTVWVADQYSSRSKIVFRNQPHKSVFFLSCCLEFSISSNQPAICFYPKAFYIKKGAFKMSVCEALFLPFKHFKGSFEAFWNTKVETGKELCCRNIPGNLCNAVTNIEYRTELQSESYPLRIREFFCEKCWTNWKLWKHTMVLNPIVTFNKLISISQWQRTFESGKIRCYSHQSKLIVCMLNLKEFMNWVFFVYVEHRYCLLYSSDCCGFNDVKSIGSDCQVWYKRS